jgi:hypothetical protein
MPPGQSTTDTVRLHLTVTDLPGVQRVLAVLTARRYALTRFAADGAGDGLWRVTLDVLADADQVELLGARLARSPSVLALGLESGAALTVTG